MIVGRQPKGAQTHFLPQLGMLRVVFEETVACATLLSSLHFLPAIRASAYPASAYPACFVSEFLPQAASSTLVRDTPRLQPQVMPEAVRLSFPLLCLA